MRNLAQSTKSLANDLIKSITGYDGYEIPKIRNKTDKRLREFLSEKLQQIEKDLSRVEHRLYQNKSNVNMDTFHRIALSLKMLNQSLVDTSCNENYFFTQTKINPDKISQLYEYDFHLVNQVDILVEEVNELDNIDGEYEIEDMLNHLYDLIDGANQTLSEREFLIMSE